MPALISEQFRIHNAQQFEEAFSEAAATNMYFFIGRPQTWDTAAVAGALSYVGQPAGSQHSGSYLAAQTKIILPLQSIVLTTRKRFLMI